MYNIVLLVSIYICASCSVVFGNEICGEIIKKHPLVTTEQLVNRQVNAFSPIPDDKFGHWASEKDFTSGVRGRDCEDYALQKARELIHRGYDKNKLEIFIVQIRLGEQIKIHATLVVKNNCVLDSNYSNPYYIYDAKWIKVLLRRTISQLNSKGIF